MAQLTGSSFCVSYSIVMSSMLHICKLLLSLGTNSAFWSAKNFKYFALASRMDVFVSKIATAFVLKSFAD